MVEALRNCKFRGAFLFDQLNVARLSDSGFCVYRRAVNCLRNETNVHELLAWTPVNASRHRGRHEGTARDGERGAVLRRPGGALDPWRGNSVDQVAGLTNRPSLRAARTEKRGLFPGGRSPTVLLSSLPPFRGEGRWTPCPPDEERPNLRACWKARSLAQYLAERSLAAAMVSARHLSMVEAVKAHVFGLRSFQECARTIRTMSKASRVARALCTVLDEIWTSPATVEREG